MYSVYGLMAYCGLRSILREEGDADVFDARPWSYDSSSGSEEEDGEDMDTTTNDEDEESNHYTLIRPFNVE